MDEEIRCGNCRYYRGFQDQSTPLCEDPKKAVYNPMGYRLKVTVSPYDYCLYFKSKKPWWRRIL